jgi:hypothetical protein
VLLGNGADAEYTAFASDDAWDSFDLTGDLSSGLSLDGVSIWGYSGGTGLPITFVDSVAVLASN